MSGASQARSPSGPDPHPPLLVPRQAMCSPNYNLIFFFFYHLWKILEGWIPMLTEHFLPTDLSKATPLPQQFCGLRNVSALPINTNTDNRERSRDDCRLQRADHSLWRLGWGKGVQQKPPFSLSAVSQARQCWILYWYMLT